MENTITLLNYAVYAYALFWTVLILFWHYQSKLKKNKFFKWIFRQIENYNIKNHPERIKKENLKLLGKIKNPKDKQFFISGFKVYAPTFKEAHKKYHDVLKLKVTYTEIKLKDYVETL